MPIDGDAVTLADPLEEVAGDPDLVTSAARALGEDLEFPLAHHHLGVDALDVKAGVEADLQVLVDDVAADGVGGTDGGVVRTLWAGETAFREADRQVGLVVPQDVFLLEAEPKIVVIVVDGGSAVGFVRGAVCIQDFAHHQPVVGADLVGIGVQGDWLEETVGVVAGGLLG